MSLQQCNFQNADDGNRGEAVVEAVKGKLNVVNCYFQVARNHIKVGQEAPEAIISSNRFTGPEKVTLENK